MEYTTWTFGNRKTSPWCVLFYSCVSSICAETGQLSQELFSVDGTVYNQTQILNDKFEVDPDLLAQYGLVCRVFNFLKAGRCC